MLFWITLVAFIISVVCFVICDRNLIGFISCGMTGTALIGMILVIICNYIPVESYVASNQERYNALIFKLENEEVRDEFGLINKSLIDQVQHWNEDVIYHHKIEKNFWVGIFYPNIYDQFETIDYTKYFKKEGI